MYFIKYIVRSGRQLDALVGSWTLQPSRTAMSIMDDRIKAMCVFTTGAVLGAAWRLVQDTGANPEAGASAGTSGMHMLEPLPVAVQPQAASEAVAQLAPPAERQRPDDTTAMHRTIDDGMHGEDVTVPALSPEQLATYWEQGYARTAALLATACTDSGGTALHCQTVQLYH